MKKKNKKSINLSKCLIIKSKDCKINQSLNSKEKKEQEWLSENKEAIESYNLKVEEHGVFSDKIRNF